MNKAAKDVMCEVLALAASKVETVGMWTKGQFARGADGKKRHYLDDDAVCWCVNGAIYKAAHELIGEAEKLIGPSKNRRLVSLDGASIAAISAVNRRAIAEGYACAADWNDAPDRTQIQVASALRELSKAASND